MNLLLYVTIIVLLILFTYSFIISVNETFTVCPYSLYKNTNKKRNQLNEFIPDIYNYTIFKDSGLMLDTDNELNLNSIEYKNLKQKLDFYKDIEKDIDSDKQLQIKLKLLEKERLNNQIIRSSAKWLLKRIIFYHKKL